MRNFLFERPNFVARGIAVMGVGLMLGFAPRFEVMDALIGPPADASSG
jgi:hypothetical protein